LGNFASGVAIHTGASNNTIGGTASSAGNTIAFNGIEGVRVISNSSTGNAILSNSVFSNSELGIDLRRLGASGVTQNDPGDGDTGPNSLQNFPVLASASTVGSNIAIEGSLSSTANTAFRLEFFANSSCDASGYGEGAIFLGSASVTTDLSGTTNFNLTYVAAGSQNQYITATATDPNNNTSEFSQCVAVDDQDGDGLLDDFEEGFGGTGVTVDALDPVASTGDAQSGSTVSAGEFAVSFPPGTASTTEIEIVFEPNATGDGDPAVQITGVLLEGNTKTITMPFGDQKVVCIDDSAEATIETASGGMCEPPKVEIVIPDDGNSNSSGSYIVSREGTVIAIEGLSNTAIVAFSYKPVEMDIKPGSDPNSWHCVNTKNGLPVAILSTGEFDATTVDAGSVHFGRLGTEAVEVHMQKGAAKRHIRDLNEDGLEDILFHFRFGDTGFGCDDISEGEQSVILTARLTGEADGVAIEGIGSLRLVKK
jgi:hypothetical protein